MASIQNKILVSIPQGLLSDTEIEQTKSTFNSEEFEINFLKTSSQPQAVILSTIITITMGIIANVSSDIIFYKIKPILDKLNQAKKEKKLLKFVAHEAPKPADISIKLKTKNSEIFLEVVENVSENHLKEQFHVLIEAGHEIEQQNSPEKYYVVHDDSKGNSNIINLEKYTKLRSKNSNLNK
ncbi:hypothetical protein EFE32_06875 [Lactococcus lactis subsp. lactis]|uniref:hypothetical protein n=1 Tax=Lactococcus lactis TaxID=1358 RepID=UPI00223B6264|nr:hypothetical protein [Lactococcus lactis]MCT0016566.1 hypothetical protein [Lactococcus lactis subsp. lactis]